MILAKNVSPARKMKCTQSARESVNLNLRNDSQMCYDIFIDKILNIFIF